MGTNLIYLCLGAILGAMARWGLGLFLNPISTQLQLGTLAANYMGCFIMGIVLAITIQYPQLSAEWRLFLITGLLGSFTTFSAFSAEVIQNLLEGKYGWSISIIILQLCGSLLCTWLGVIGWRWIKG